MAGDPWRNYDKRINMVTKIDGYKTYAAIAVAVLIIVLQQFGIVGDAGVPWEDFTTRLFTLLGVAGVRHAIGPNRSNRS